jgi:LacI family transcriptional regulator
MKLTINEIAAMAQVAKSTVSKALNGQKGVSDEKRAQILDLAARLDYHPNASAQALASNRSGSIGLLLPHQAGHSLSSAYWSAVISAVAREARSRGYNLLILSPGPGDDIVEPIGSLLKRRNVDGLVLGAERLDSRAVAILGAAAVPYVLIGRSPGIQHYSVDVDNEAASRSLVSYLAEKGWRRVACLAGPEEYLYTRQRVAGYRQALEEAGLEWQRVEYSPYPGGPESSAALDRLLGEGPDALFVTAGGEFILDALDAIKRREPEPSRFGLAVFDDYRFFDYLGLPVARMRQPLGEIGAKAASLLFMLMDGRQPERMEWVLEAEAVLH